MAQDLYVAIATDTGNFIYSNTTQKTHLIVAELMNCGIDVPMISRNLYQNIPLKKFQFDAHVLDHVKFSHEGKLGYVAITDQMQRMFNCDNTDNIAEAIRDIEGVEVSIMATERAGAVKVSMRSKEVADVAEIAQRHGGGGHTNAAGFGTEMTLLEIIETLEKEFEILVQREN
jgi:phosphoesterase RecJ-like protein